jgi:hypothetical protein
VNDRRTIVTAPALKLIETVECLRRPGENAFDTAKRELVREALYLSGGKQIEAARLLGISTPLMNRYAAKAGARPKDRAGVAVTRVPPAAARGSVG